MKTLLTLLFVAAIGLAATQAFGVPEPLEGMKNSGDFDFKYEMDVNPASQNLDAAGGGTGDWAYAGVAPEPTYDGLMNINTDWMEYHGGSGFGDIFDNPTLDGFNNAYTMEIKLKLDIVSTFNLAVQTGAIADSGIMVDIEDTAVSYNSPGSGFVTIHTENTQGTWHTYRLVGHKYSVSDDNVWSMWMDDNLIMDAVDLGSDGMGGRRLTIGNIADIDLVGQVDYFRITSGAWAPDTGPLTGDLDGNGFIDESDLQLVKNDWGSTTLLTADINGDGIVGGPDAEIIRDHWHWGTPPPVGSSSVPEPGSLALLAIGSLMLLARRRRCRV